MSEVIQYLGGEVEVVYGPGKAGSKKDVADVCKNILWVQSDIKAIKSQFVKLGFHLHEIYNTGAYRKLGFDNFYGFCEANFHLSQSSVSRYINIYLRFSKEQGYTKTMFIDDRWKDYSYSQLCEMLALPEYRLKEVKPSMTVKEIRELKKKKGSVCDVAYEPEPEQTEPKPEPEEVEVDSPVCDVAYESKSEEPESGDTGSVKVLRFSLEVIRGDVFQLKKHLEENSYCSALPILETIDEGLRNLLGE